MNPSNIIKILDEGEYLRHQESMNYSKDLDLQIKKSLNEVLEMCRARVYPFNDEVIIKLYDQYLSLSKTV
jgi:protein associated with RNAse G/E